MDLIRVRHEGEVAILAPAMQRLDAAVAPAFKQAVLERIAAGDTRLVLDLGELTFLDSSGLGVLVAILKALGGKGEVAVCNAKGAVLSLFQLTRMDRVFALEAGCEQAVARVAPR